jgi:hypothetical protein
MKRIVRLFRWPKLREIFSHRRKNKILRIDEAFDQSYKDIQSLRKQEEPPKHDEDHVELRQDKVRR